MVLLTEQPPRDGQPGIAVPRLTDSGEELLRHAEAITRQQFGRKVFVRGVVEVSNFCRENCTYCGMRRDNRNLARFRASHEELAELILHHRPACMTDLNIQAGEDPIAAREIVVPLVRTLRRETRLGISVCLGTLPESLYQQLQSAGAALYIMKFETADPDLYRRIEAPGSLAERIQHIRHLAATGWHVSSGFIAGLPGETPSILRSNLDLAAALPLAGCSVSPFIPGETTPLGNENPANLESTLECMARLRLAHPEWFIPAVSALNLTGDGSAYIRGLQAGANLCTINLTPPKIRSDYILYKRSRTIMDEHRILDAIAAAGLEPSPASLLESIRTRTVAATPS